MKANKAKKALIGLFVSVVSMFAFSSVAFAKYYNVPTYSKVEVVRNPQGQSYHRLFEAIKRVPIFERCFIIFGQV